ncbi:regulatory protein RecX [Ideonella sp. DXS22W]|uniref:Regulatory protein RecX n=1 Tax=Pseudaquabacterium inlustre TaxID=2984192 RepID=A0ABU9CIK0_9BURK
MPPRPASLKVRALQWLAQREHSRAELRARLLRAAAGRPVPPPAVSAPGWAAPLEGPAGDGDTFAADAPDDDSQAGADPVDHAPEVDALLDWLSARGYLSDQRFIDSRIHTRQGRYGNLRIERELAQHGLAPDADTRQQLRDTELARAHEVWQRKYGAPAADPGERLRQMRFLAGRGFSSDVVRRVIRGLTDDEA